MNDEIKFSLQNSNYRTATFEILLEILAQQVTIKEMLIAHMATNDDDIAILNHQHDQKLNLRLAEIYDSIYSRYGNLPNEISELLSDRKRDK